ncbi:hypothetical protein A2U01_0084594, partial [Trifolium medium]|nr:hypothetical protein [Trifolium medium]
YLGGLSPYHGGEYRGGVSCLLGLGGLSYLLRGRGDLDLVMLRLLSRVGISEGDHFVKVSSPWTPRQLVLVDFGTTIFDSARESSLL